MSDVKVSLGFVYQNSRPATFDDCRERMLAFDRNNLGLFCHERGRVSTRSGTDGLVAARNSVVRAFLDGPADWLLWVDSDMGFDEDAPYRLLQVADPVERPIVGGLCFVNREYAHDGMMGFRTRPVPTLYDWREDTDGVPKFLSNPMYPVNALVRTAATGSAFVLIHRSVFERMAQTAEGDPKFGEWYDRIRGHDGKHLGEDVSFCARAGLLDIPVFVYTGVRTTHFKNIWLGEADHWFRYVAPQATEQTAVIVPTLGRPQNADPFMTSLRASTGLATAYAVCDADDPQSVEAWSAAGAQVIVDNAVTFARKVNLGYAKTSEPWLFLVGDDVRFHAAWLDHAQHVADVLQADVVGTNDLGNPRVMRGEHATHMLIRRSYVDAVGGSWDGPGVVAHEGYRHWSVDDELVTAAKQRGVWQMALGSVVEHNHPLWGKGKDDPTYRIGPAHAEADRALFESRLAANS